jgi:hypothetical protein
MTLNATPLTEPLWRQLPPALRARLRRRLDGKAGILNRQVLDVARALCDRGAYGIALALYDALDGQPEAAHGCGFGMLWALRERMGEAEGPDPSNTLLL